MLKEILKNATGVPTGEYKNVAGGTLYADAPLGTILPFGGATAPIGWFLCQGQAISRITYADLFAVIGTNFGAGDGSTTFNIPDLRGEFLRGAGTNSHEGQGSGGAVGVHQNATEIGNTYGIGAGTLGWTVSDNTIQNADKMISGTVQGLTGDSQRATIGNAKFLTRPTNTSVNYIIKAKMVALPADLEAAIEEGEKYSTTEVKTNKTWIDGKPIYRKVYVFPSNVAVQGNAWTSTGMAKPANIEAIVGVSTIVRPDQRSYCVDVSATTSDTNLTIALLSNVTLNITQNSKLVLEYTKTTD